MPFYVKRWVIRMKLSRVVSQVLDAKVQVDVVRAGMATTGPRGTLRRRRTQPSASGSAPAAVHCGKRSPWLLQ